jgi:putative flippase GtrA
MKRLPVILLGLSVLCGVSIFFISSLMHPYDPDHRNLAGLLIIVSLGFIGSVAGFVSCFLFAQRTRKMIVNALLLFVGFIFNAPQGA